MKSNQKKIKNSSQGKTEIKYFSKVILGYMAQSKNVYTNRHSRRRQQKKYIGEGIFKLKAENIPGFIERNMIGFSKQTTSEEIKRNPYPYTSEETTDHCDQ